MGAISNIYVDPSIAGDSGAGTVGDPYGDLEYAIEQTTFDTTNGHQVNIKAGTDEILAAELSVAIADTGTAAAWVPSESAPITFRGYTSAANDGGIGGISGGGSVSVINDAVLDNISFIDLHCHNCGSADIIYLDNFCAVINCQINNTSGTGIRLDATSVIAHNYIHDIGSVGVRLQNSGQVFNNYLADGTKTFTEGIETTQAAYSMISNNIIKLTGNGIGIKLQQDTAAMANSIFSAGGTGKGITYVGGARIPIIANNVIEGFSGAGGVGFDVDVSGVSIVYYEGNAAYNNTTNYATISDKARYDGTDNEVLSASPFTDATNGDFNPVDTGNVKEGAAPGDFNDT